MNNITHIIIRGRRWPDKYGNTYHTTETSVVYWNGKVTTIKTPGNSLVYDYGYGDHYVTTALAWLVDAKILPDRAMVEGLKAQPSDRWDWRSLSEHGIELTRSAVDVRLRGDL